MSQPPGPSCVTMVSFSFGYDSGDQVIWNVEGDYVKTLEAIEEYDPCSLHDLPGAGRCGQDRDPAMPLHDHRQAIFPTGTLKPSRGAKTAWDPRS